jgi:hypothetical protein
MLSKSLVRFVVLLAVIALALPAMAKPVSKSITLSQPARMGQSQLEAGDYRLLIDGTKVTVQRGKQVMAVVEGQWEQRDAKAARNAIVLGTGGVVKEIRFAGDRRVLVIATP